MAPSKDDPLIGLLVAGRYRVIRPLGEGGMGQVYLAEHEAIEKKVALKVLRPEYSRKEDIVTRFQQEAISASRIKHPNVLDVFDFGRLDGGEAFLAMEFLEGHDLAEELAKYGSMDPSRGLHVTLQICRALAAAHARGVVHRDMKPDNVFLQRTGDEEVVKIVDFGIAQLRTTEEAAKSEPKRRRLTKTGMIFGTPEYMAPEQAGGRHADLRVDVYALGVILYEMFTGAVPFTGDSFMEVLTAIMTTPPPSMRQMNPELRIGPELEAVVMKALSKNPDERFVTMTAFAAALMATPEGAPFARPMPGSLADARASAYPPAGVATAAQFGQNSVPTAAPSAAPTAMSPGQSAAVLGTPGQGTAALGTPGDVANRKTTQLGGQSSSVAPAHGASRGLILGSLGFVVVVLGAGGYFAFGRAPGTSKDTAPVSTLTPEPAASEVHPVPSSSVAETTVAPAPMPSPEVRLHLVTQPAGASVSKGGFQVCAAAPCDVTVPRNEGVEFDAEKGALRGNARILPQDDQTVTISLALPAKPQHTGPRLCEMLVDGLKILRPCGK